MLSQYLLVYPHDPLSFMESTNFKVFQEMRMKPPSSEPSGSFMFSCGSLSRLTPPSPLTRRPTLSLSISSPDILCCVLRRIFLLLLFHSFFFGRWTFKRAQSLEIAHHETHPTHAIQCREPRKVDLSTFVIGQATYKPIMTEFHVPRSVLSSQINYSAPRNMDALCRP